MRADYDDARDRAIFRKGRLPVNKAQYLKLEKRFEKMFSFLLLPKRQLNTSEIKLEDGVESICQALKKLDPG